MDIVKGIAITPPIIGRISMGSVSFVEKKGRNIPLPIKHDHFTITTRVQDPETRKWEIHPVHEKLAGGKDGLTSIPVRIAFNRMDLNCQNMYQAFDTSKGYIVCAGNGVQCKRFTNEGLIESDCPGPDLCAFAKSTRCQNTTRAYFRIDEAEDELGYFYLRSHGRNTLNRLIGRLSQISGLTKQEMMGVPMQLVILAETSAKSFWQKYWVADLKIRQGMTLIQAVEEGKVYRERLSKAGLDIAAAESNLVAGMANSLFGTDEVDDPEEWFLSDESLAEQAQTRAQTINSGNFHQLDQVMRKLGQLDQGVAGESVQVNGQQPKHIQPENSTILD